MKNWMSQCMPCKSSAVKAGDWRALTGLLLLALGLVTLAGGQTEKSAARPDLTGTIRDLANHPISNATVSIYAAWPKDVEGIESRSTDDCRKHTTTDANGRFIIKALDTNALFQILFTDKGFRPMFYWRIDPAAKALDVTIEPLSSGTRPEEQVHGRVVGPDGKPVSGALIKVIGGHREKGWQLPVWHDIDYLVFTDDSGEFVIHGQSNFISCDLTVEASGFAPSGEQSEVSTGNIVHEFRLTKGAYLKGRLLKYGKPVANAGIGISGIKADWMNGNFSVVTDGEGRFSFENIPPDRDYYLFGIMRSLKDRGALPLRHVQVGKAGSIQDVGDLNLEPAFTVSGTVRLSDGQPAPAGSIVTLCRTVMTPPSNGESPQSEDSNRSFYGLEDDLDNWVIRGIGKDARFQFSGVPAGSVSIFIMVPPGFHLSSRNASADTVGWRLLGRVVANKTDLVFELERGQQQGKPAPVDYQALSQKLLRGAE